MSSPTPTLLPLALVCLFLGIGVGLRSFLQRRRHGSSGIVLFKDAGAGRLRDSALLILPFVLIGQSLAAWLRPQLLVPLAIEPAPSAPLQTAGAVIVIIATFAMLVAQLNMGRSWRIGIERDTRPGLVIDGAFAICRNPIYACMLAALFGFTLLTPTYLSLGLWVSTWVGIRMQVVEEEAFLLHSYGDTYRHYAARVGRFFPGVGLLRES